MRSSMSNAITDHKMSLLEQTKPSSGGLCLMSDILHNSNSFGIVTSSNMQFKNSLLRARDKKLFVGFYFRINLRQQGLVSESYKCNQFLSVDPISNEFP